MADSNNTPGDLSKSAMAIVIGSPIGRRSLVSRAEPAPKPVYITTTVSGDAARTALSAVHDPGDREGEEDEPHPTHDPAPALPGMGLPGFPCRDGHGYCRPRLRRTSQVASTAKIVVHTATLATDIHSASCTRAPFVSMTLPSVNG